MSGLTCGLTCGHGERVPDRFGRLDEKHRRQTVTGGVEAARFTMCRSIVNLAPCSSYDGAEGMRGRICCGLPFANHFEHGDSFIWGQSEKMIRQAVAPLAAPDGAT